MCAKPCPTCQAAGNTGSCDKPDGHDMPHQCGGGGDPMNADLSTHYWDDDGKAWSDGG
jgi:hypothetical protein